MTDVAAAMGIQQLKKIWAFQKKRQAMAERYDAALRDLPVTLPPQPLPGDMHAWHLYILRLTDDAPLQRDRFIERMIEKGIGCSVHFIPLHIQPYYRETYKLSPDDFPHAYREFRRAVSLPLYTKMTDDDQERVIAAVRELLGA
jgi:dTDP-4-amino-4,6-dideoxygalactose transaminase